MRLRTCIVESIGKQKNKKNMRRKENEKKINSIFAGIVERKNETRKGRSTHNKKGKYYIMEKEEE